MDIIQRLRKYLEYKNVSVTQFADACNIPRPSVSQLLNGRNRKVSDEVIAKIHAAYPDLSMLWLMFGEGTMLTTGISPSQGSLDLENETPTLMPTHYEVKKEETPTAFPWNGAKRMDNTRKTEKVEFISSPSGTSEIRKAEVNVKPSSKRVVTIIVYYDDNSFEPFVPDTSGRNPFIPKN